MYVLGLISWFVLSGFFAGVIMSLITSYRPVSKFLFVDSSGAAGLAIGLYSFIFGVVVMTVLNVFIVM